MKDQKFWIKIAAAVVAVVGVCTLVVAIIKTRKAKLRAACDFELDFDQNNEADEQLDPAGQDTLPEADTYSGLE